MHELLDVVSVTTKPGYKLLLKFENGETRVFDMSPYMEKRPFTAIKTPAVFDLATIEYGTVVWPGDIDIAPETLYDNSVPA